MQLFQLLGAPKVVGSGAEHKLALIDFDRTGWVRITTTASRLALPGSHADIELRDTAMTHGPYCGGEVKLFNCLGYMKCQRDECPGEWLVPIEPRILTLGQLIEHFDSLKGACTWKHSRRVVDGTAVQ